MSVIIYRNDVELKPEEFIGDTQVLFNKQMSFIDKHQETVKLVFKVEGCRVKYTPEKYDKITIELYDKALETFKKMQDLIGEQVSIQSFVKDSFISLKVKGHVKDTVQKELKRDNYIDVVIVFNGVWTVSGNKYTSLELIQYKKLDHVPEHSMPNYF